MIGYRINWPEEEIAWKALQFEYEELGNREDASKGLAKFLGVQGSWEEVLSQFRQKYGDAKGTWLTRSRRTAIEYYGYLSSNILVWEYDHKLIIVDLGDDGLFVLNAVFVREEARR